MVEGVQRFRQTPFFGPFANISVCQCCCRAWEFTCKDCGEGFEVDCHMNEREEKAVCPECVSRNVEIVLTSNFVSPRPSKD